MLYFSILSIIALLPLVHSDSSAMSTKPVNSSALVTCSKKSDECKSKIRDSVCLLSKGQCICKVGFRQVKDVCIKILCYSNADCNQQRYEQDSRDTLISDTVCDIVHNQCTCLEGYYETAEGLCAFGSHFDWTIIAINVGLCLAFSTFIVILFCLCLWCVFDEPFSKCKKCADTNIGRHVYKSEDGPTLKGMMSAKSSVFGGPTLKLKKKKGQSSMMKKSSSKTTQSLKKNKPKNLVQ